MNLLEETRDGYTISADMKKVWAVEMKLLKKLLDVCDRHHLRIWAEGGTLLGTIRHHGFIPWDDDIDMAMLRDDYDKLQAIAGDEFQAPFFFQSGYTDQFAWGFSKLRMDGTAAILPSDIYQQHHLGIFIDIFCYDAVPDDKNEIKKQMIMREKKIRMLQSYCHSTWSFSDIMHNVNIIRAKWIVHKNGFVKCFREYEDIFKKNNITDFDNVSFISFYFELERFLRNKHWYDETIYLPFEDILIPVPKDYDKILKLQYGDYMKPVHVPTMHGGFEVLDPDRSYLEFLPSLRKKHKHDIWKLRRELLFKRLGFKDLK